MREGIDAVGRAIGILKQQNFDRKQAEKSLLQLNKVSQAEKAQMVSLKVRGSSCASVSPV